MSDGNNLKWFVLSIKEGGGINRSHEPQMVVVEFSDAWCQLWVVNELLDKKGLKADRIETYWVSSPDTFFDEFVDPVKIGKNRRQLVTGYADWEFVIIEERLKFASPPKPLYFPKLRPSINIFKVVKKHESTFLILKIVIEDNANFKQAIVKSIELYESIKLEYRKLFEWKGINKKGKDIFRGTTWDDFISSLVQ